MTDDLDDAARERAEHVREKRHERADPNDRVGRVRAQEPDVEDVELPAADAEDDGVELPASLREEVEDTRKKLTYGLAQEFGIDLDPDDQFRPLVVHLGLERLKGMWLEEVRRTLETEEYLADSDGE